MFEYSNEQRIELADALDRLLSTSKDFNKVFTIGYARNYILELVDRLAMYDHTNPEYANTIRKIEAISLFNAYLNEVYEQGQSAKDEIAYLSRTPDIEE